MESQLGEWTFSGIQGREILVIEDMPDSLVINICCNGRCVEGGKDLTILGGKAAVREAIGREDNVFVVKNSRVNGPKGENIKKETFTEVIEREGHNVKSEDAKMESNISEGKLKHSGFKAKKVANEMVDQRLVKRICPKPIETRVRNMLVGTKQRVSSKLYEKPEPTRYYHKSHVVNETVSRVLDIDRETRKTAEKLRIEEIRKANSGDQIKIRPAVLLLDFPMVSEFDEDGDMISQNFSSDDEDSSIQYFLDEIPMHPGSIVNKNNPFYDQMIMNKKNEGPTLAFYDSSDEDNGKGDVNEKAAGTSDVDNPGEDLNEASLQSYGGSASVKLDGGNGCVESGNDRASAESDSDRCSSKSLDSNTSQATQIYVPPTTYSEVPSEHIKDGLMWLPQPSPEVVLSSSEDEEQDSLYVVDTKPQLVPPMNAFSMLQRSSKCVNSTPYVPFSKGPATIDLQESDDGETFVDYKVANGPNIPFATYEEALKKVDVIEKIILKKDGSLNTKYSPIFSSSSESEESETGFYTDQLNKEIGDEEANSRRLKKQREVKKRSSKSSRNGSNSSLTSANESEDEKKKHEELLKQQQRLLQEKANLEALWADAEAQLKVKEAERKALEAKRKAEEERIEKERNSRETERLLDETIERTKATIGRLDKLYEEDESY
uniref:ULP_PROTEASE domain-containing protein n=1 Tax=Rhabditophanes sp. KR3021 TaxID=114890 RepID=A0AC35UHZ1_9BILA